jgi:hypothetical protein
VQDVPFSTIHLGDVLVFGTLIIMLLSYRSDRRKEVTAQLTMHAENKEKLETLTAFQEAQQELNRMRDQQINQLTQQTATLTQMAAGQERRLQMIENRRG